MKENTTGATEKRLIDANVFAEHLERMAKTTYPNLLPGLLEAAEYARDFLPTVDAVEVVRCNACQSHEPCEVKGRVWCKKLCRYMKEDGFCSEGNTDA